MDPFNIHAKDQAEAAFRDMAGILRGYYKNLKDAGFTTVEALKLTAAMQNSFMDQVKSKGNE